MRFTVTSFVWTGTFTDRHVDLLPAVAELGFDEIEIAFYGPGHINPALVRERLMAAGLGATVLAYCLPDRDVSSADPAVCKAGRRYLTDAIDFAAEIGAAVVAGPIAHPPGRARFLPAADREAERRRSATSLRTVGDRAGERGIRLGVELLSRYDSDMFNTATEALSFLAEVGHERVGLLLDTFHMMIEEQSAGDAVRQVGPQLIHFHAVESHRGEVGTGQIDWDDVFTALVDIGYDGAVSIDSVAPTGTDFDAMLNMWRPWFKDPKTFASGSLGFCRSHAASAEAKPA